MSSGNKSILIVVNERAEPVDILALQQYEAQRSGEVARWLVAAKLQGSFSSNPGMHSAYESIADAAVPTDEVAHQCLSGLMVRPGTTFCAVDPGGAAFYQPARAGLTADDTPWIFGFSPGLNDPTQLTFLANAGPGIRWDIIECQVGPDAVQSQASRQMFDPVLQVFSAQNVDKVQASAFTFRIRRGVQGGGIPAIAADWMPLAAVHVRTDSSSYADTDLYDIRPLTTDRCEWSARHAFAAPASGFTDRHVLEEAEFSPQVQGGINGLMLRGYFRSHFGGYWSGGEIRTNLPAVSAANFGGTGVSGANFDSFNFERPEWRSGAFALAADTLVTLGAFFPRGYPRWVRYSQVTLASNTNTRLRAAGRYPQGCRGILAVLNGSSGGGLVAKNGFIAGATMPAGLGETTGAHGHVVCYAAVGSAGNDVYPPAGSAIDQKYVWPTDSVSYVGASAPGPDFTLLVNQDNGGAAFVMDAGANPAANHSGFVDISAGGVSVPKSAAAILTEVQSVLTLITAKRLGQTTVKVDVGGVCVDVHASLNPITNDTGGTVQFLQQLNLWLPLRPNFSYDGQAAVGATRLAMRWAGAAAGTFNATPFCSIRFKGYQL